MAMMTIVRVHAATGTDALLTTDVAKASGWVKSANKCSGEGAWAAVPPVGSDWERADWDALARRAGA